MNCTTAVSLAMVVKDKETRLTDAVHVGAEQNTFHEKDNLLRLLPKCYYKRCPAWDSSKQYVYDRALRQSSQYL